MKESTMLRTDLQEKAKWLAGFTATVGLLGTGLGTLKGPTVGGGAFLLYLAGFFLAVSLALFSIAYFLSEYREAFSPEDPSENNSSPSTANLGEFSLVVLAALALSIALVVASISPWVYYHNSSHASVTLEIELQELPVDGTGQEILSATLAGAMVERTEFGWLRIWVVDSVLRGDTLQEVVVDLTQARDRSGMDGVLSLQARLDVCQWAGHTLTAVAGIQEPDADPTWRRDTTLVVPDCPASSLGSG